MGSFSFMKANDVSVGVQNNFIPGDSIRILVPKEWGGGYEDALYCDYGIVEFNDGMRTDLYDLIHHWNTATPCADSIMQVDDFTDANRILGIEMACLDGDHILLKFPLKFVSPDSGISSYEDTKGFSLCDSNQGIIKEYQKEGVLSTSLWVSFCRSLLSYISVPEWKFVMGYSSVSIIHSDTGFSLDFSRDDTLTEQIKTAASEFVEVDFINDYSDGEDTSEIECVAYDIENLLSQLAFQIDEI